MTIKELQVVLATAIELIGEDAQVCVEDFDDDSGEFIITEADGWGIENKYEKNIRRFILR